MSIYWGTSTMLALHWMVCCFLSSQSRIATDVDRLLAPNSTWLLRSAPFPSIWCETRLKIPGTTAHTARAFPLCTSCRWLWPAPRHTASGHLRASLFRHYLSDLFSLPHPGDRGLSAECVSCPCPELPHPPPLLQFSTTWSCMDPPVSCASCAPSLLFCMTGHQ